MSKGNSEKKHCTIRLSTGYEVQIAPGTFDENTEHLANAIIGEVITPLVKENREKEVAPQVEREIYNTVKSLDEETKAGFLYLYIEHQVWDKWEQLRKELESEYKS